MYENLERCDSVFVQQAKVKISLQTLQINHRFYWTVFFFKKQKTKKKTVHGHFMFTQHN